MSSHETSVASLKMAYLTARPFPHLVIDRHFDDGRLARVASEVGHIPLSPGPEFYGQRRKLGQQDRHRMGPETAAILEEMNGPAFVTWLGKVTGIDGLVADPSLFGGGVHQVKRGGFLKIHADFSWHEALRLYRRVNVLLYLNPVWADQWGGHLELWPTAMDCCGVRIAPLLNRMVIFSTSDDSFHGHPEPLACPEGITRNALALYYYSKDPSPGTRRSTITNYRARPVERFKGLRRLVHAAKLRIGI